MLISADTDEVWTFNDVDQYSNRMATFLRAQGFCRGDVIALYMENKPKYIGLILGMAKLGVEAALINYNLTDDVSLNRIRNPFVRCVFLCA